MKISGRSLKEHVRLLVPILGFVTAVWALNVILISSGAPRWLLRPLSILLATSVSVFLITLLIHRRRFGGYSNVVLTIFLLMLWVQSLIAIRILFLRLIGVELPHRLPVPTPDLKHAVGHLTVGLGFTTMLGSAMGCFLLFLFRKLMPSDGQSRR